MSDPTTEAAPEVSKNKRFRKDKPWDTDDIDHWKIEPMTAPGKGTHQPFLEESSFALLFPKYRETYLRSIWGGITSSLDAVGLACELDLVQGRMSVRTTRKTWDPYVILKGRDLLKLLSRGVAAPQALKVLQDGVACDVIKISGIVRNKERFVKRRQRIVGPGGSTLKAIELLTDCYVLVQGNTVSAMGSWKGLKEVRRIVLDCMNNIHPIYRIKELMLRRELAKDPKLANESWDRFLPKFQKKHLKTSEKTAGKNAALEGKDKEPAKKKVYTPFPPAQTLRKEDIAMQTGEYFLKASDKKSAEDAERVERHAAADEKRRAKREEMFVAPAEEAAPTLDERRKKRKLDRDAKE
ncbi:hypothetical protein CspHIS471_0609930 [Cutaneotrichosporon sp. HIS471]|nr:hypothetical protein CspHIS471_0609930 [Cutaneotrichosporon sp. HIS471]